MNVAFYGVRGSTPCSTPAMHRYGGNTSCVVIDVPDGEPILLDLGTGLRFFGSRLGGRIPFRGHALVTHLHWDHVQGLPFFEPLHHPDSVLEVHGPTCDGSSFGECFSMFMNPPLFPIHYSQLIGEVRFHDVNDHAFEIGPATVTARPVPHVGVTNGYRVEVGGRTVVYVSDHQQPVDDPTAVDEGVLELAEGADLLIHDAQFTPEQFPERSDWGHCTVGYALEVAHQAGARSLALFHHDPAHDDDHLDDLLCQARKQACRLGIRNVVSAFEGLRLDLHR